MHAILTLHRIENPVHGSWKALTRVEQSPPLTEAPGPPGDTDMLRLAWCPKPECGAAPQIMYSGGAAIPVLPGSRSSTRWCRTSGATGTLRTAASAMPTASKSASTSRRNPACAWSAEAEAASIRAATGVSAGSPAGFSRPTA